VNIVIVVGLRAEALLARRLGVPVVVGGGTTAGAEAAARRAVAAGATALLSFGLAGGLDPNLRPGALVVPSAVLCDGALSTADSVLLQLLGGATQRVLVAVNAVVADAAGKRRLWEATQAAALDLESGAVARVATAQGLPFAALRAVCDPAERDLPPAALVALDVHGGIGLARIAASVIARPAQLPALLRLAADAAAARRTLAATSRFPLRGPRRSGNREIISMRPDRQV
jgi:adenosylhomocysteine nucleosidase